MSTDKKTEELMAADAAYILIEPIKEDGCRGNYRDVDAHFAKWQMSLVFPLGDSCEVSQGDGEDFSDAFARISAKLPDLKVAYKDDENDLPADHPDSIVADLMGVILDDPEMEDADVTDDHILEELRTIIDEAQDARRSTAPAV
jgi:hypothetical protein